MTALKTNPQTRFVIIFICLFLLFYYFNVIMWGLVTPGGAYSPFLAHHFDYIGSLRSFLVVVSTKIINAIGYVAIHDTDEILVAGHGIIRISYDCFGLGVMSFFAAFVIAYPKPFKQKIIVMVIGLISIQLLNLCRFVILAIYLRASKVHLVDHHTIFNIFIYIVISLSLYFWIKEPRHQPANAKN